MHPALQEYLPQFLELHQQLAQQHHICIVAGSLPVKYNHNYINRTYVFGSSGQISHQEKLIITRFGDHGLLFGVVTCYDSEFPMLSRQLAEAGAEVLLIPSFTGDRVGYTRVRVGNMARALENQCYAMHAPLIAQANWTYAVEDAEGMTGVYCPSDNSLPENGILASGKWNTPGRLITKLDLRRIR